jgi:hypothetical protein
MSNNNLIVFIAMTVTIAFFVGLTIWLILWSNKVQKRRAWLKEHGKQITATVIHISGNTSASRKGNIWEVIWGVLKIIGAIAGSQYVEPAAPALPESRMWLPISVRPETTC